MMVISASHHPGAETHGDGQGAMEEFGEDGSGHLRALSPRFLMMMMRRPYERQVISTHYDEFKLAAKNAYRSVKMTADKFVSIRKTV
jgi:hypothetical protein